MHSAARVLEMEANALIVCAGTMRVVATRLPAGHVRRFLYEQAALWEESATTPAEGDARREAAPGVLRFRLRRGH